MQVHVNYGQERIWITLGPITFDGRAHPRLRQDQVGKFCRVYGICVSLKLLDDEPLEGMIVNRRVRVEKLEVDIDEALLRQPK